MTEAIGRPRVTQTEDEGEPGTGGWLSWRRRAPVVVVGALLALGCGPDGASHADGGGSDSGMPGADAGEDADGGGEDSDGGANDGGANDAGAPVGLPGEPRLLFSDITAASNSGWSAANPERGAVVTVWGRNFGATRNTSYVTVNGVDLTADVDYVDLWGETSNPVPFLETITFQLNRSIPEGPGEITVTVDGVESNPIPFRVHAGNIYFVDSNAAGGGTGTHEDPWQDLSEFIAVMAPGDVAYFREGVYDERYNGGKQNIWVRPSEASGTAELPIAFVGYPNEVALFDSVTHGDASNFNKSIKIDAAYITIAKVHTRALGPGIQLGNHGRAIGNDVVGAQEFLQGTGLLIAGGNGVQMLGNSVHGARSGNRLDHAIYLSGCASIEGAEVAYNHSFDQVFDRGPHFVVNSQEDRCRPDQQLQSHRFHHNVIDCTGSPSRGIGVFDQSWDLGEAAEPEPTFVYNNIIVRCVPMYHNNGHAVFTYNTLIESIGAAVLIRGGLVLSTVVTNNVITMADATGTYVSGTPTAEHHNLYFGGDDSSISGAATDILTADPMVTFDLATLAFGLPADSPAVDAADSSGTGYVVDDFRGVGRPQGAGPDMGALEHTDLEPE